MACGDKGGGGKTVTFELPSLPVSINALYEINFRKREVNLKPEARRWKSSSKEYVPRFDIAPDSFLRIDFTFYYRFYAANGNLRDFDSPNLLKLAIDCIAEKLGIRDKRVKTGSWDSEDSPNGKVVVTLTEVKRGPTTTTTTNP